MAPPSGKEAARESQASKELKSFPAIAVVPLKDLSTGSKDANFADGVTSDLITELMRFNGVSVMARSTSFLIPQWSLSATELGKRLHVEYLLEGDIRRTPDRLRINVQLVETSSGREVWSESYDRKLTTGNIFDVQDEIVGSVVTQIGSTYGVVLRNELAFSSNRDAANMTAYDCYLQMLRWWRSPSMELHKSTRSCMEREVSKDPEYASGWAALSRLYSEEFALKWNVRSTPEAALRDAIAAGEKAVVISPKSIWAHQSLAMAYFYSKDLQRFYREIDRVLALNPKDLDVIGDLGANATWSGNYAKGVPLLTAAMKGSPGYPLWYHHALVVMYYDHGDFQAALAEAKQCTLPELFTTHLWLAAVFGELDRIKEAQPSVKAMERLWPGFHAEDARLLSNWNVPSRVVERVIASLRKVGVPSKAGLP